VAEAATLAVTPDTAGQGEIIRPGGSAPRSWGLIPIPGTQATASGGVLLQPVVATDERQPLGQDKGGTRPQPESVSTRSAPTALGGVRAPSVTGRSRGSTGREPERRGL